VSVLCNLLYLFRSFGLQFKQGVSDTIDGTLSTLYLACDMVKQLPRFLDLFEKLPRLPFTAKREAEVFFETQDISTGNLHELIFILLDGNPSENVVMHFSRENSHRYKQVYLHLHPETCTDRNCLFGVIL